MRFSFVLIFFVLSGTLNCLAGSPAAETVLQAMRNNDKKFDNIALYDERTWTGTVKSDPFHFVKYGDDPSRMPADYWDLVEYAAKSQDLLIVRGDHCVLSVDFDDKMGHEDKYDRVGNGYSKTGIFGEVYCMIHDMQLSEDDPSKNSPNYEKQLRVREWTHEISALHDTQMARELTHGIGYGKRILKVDTFQPVDNHFKMTGILRLWKDDQSRFELELDADYLVRKASLFYEKDKTEIRFDITTVETIKQDGIKLAKAGTYRRIRVSTGRVENDYSLELKKVETNLSSQRYLELADFPVQPLMQYNNSMTGLNGTGVTMDDGTVGVKLRSGEIIKAPALIPVDQL